MTDGKYGPRLQPVNRQCSQPFPATVGLIIKYLKPAYKVPKYIKISFFSLYHFFDKVLYLFYLSIISFKSLYFSTAIICIDTLKFIWNENNSKVYALAYAEKFFISHTEVKIKIRKSKF